MEDNNRILFIRGISDDVDKNLLFSAFSQFGTVLNVEIPKDREKDKNKNIAFVEFEDPEDAKHAIFNRHNSELYGKIIKVAYSNNSSMYNPNKHKFKAIWDEDPNFNNKQEELVQQD